MLGMESEGAEPQAGIELSFTELRTADWAAAVRWYLDVLGLRLVLEDVGHRFALLEAGASRLALRGGGDVTAPGHRLRLVFRVDDVDATRERLLRWGVDVGPAVDNPREPYRSVVLHDLEGTPITLFSWIDRPVVPPQS
jgi:catechol 2,3-dioxygenase-like lactoylglutathione lyase family enzyme